MKQVFDPSDAYMLSALRMAAMRREMLDFEYQDEAGQEQKVKSFVAKVKEGEGERYIEIKDGQRISFSQILSVKGLVDDAGSREEISCLCE